MNRSSMSPRDIIKVVRVTLILAILFIWSSMWTDLRSFETNTSFHVLDQYCEELKAQAESGNCASILQSSKYRVTYSALSHAGKALADLAQGKEINYENILLDDGTETVFYNILADGEVIAKISLEEKENFGILRLPMYTVTSIVGTQNYSVAARDTDNKMVYDVKLSDLKSNESGFIFPTLAEIDAIDPTLGIPDFDVYNFEQMFAAPDARTADASSAPLPLYVMEGGYRILGDNPPFELSAGMTSHVKEVVKKFCYFLSGDVEWDLFKGNVMSTAPLYERIEKKGGQWSFRQVSTELSEIEILNPIQWNDTIISCELRFDYSIFAPEGTKVYHMDNIYYFHLEEDDEWRLFEMAEV